MYSTTVPFLSSLFSWAFTGPVHWYWQHTNKVSYAAEDEDQNPENIPAKLACYMEQEVLANF